MADFRAEQPLECPRGGDGERLLLADLRRPRTGYAHSFPPLARREASVIGARSGHSYASLLKGRENKLATTCATTKEQTKYVARSPIFRADEAVFAGMAVRISPKTIK